MLGNGVTEPLLCILDNDKRAVVKVFNNCQGNLTLVNEYICYKLACALGLPMPNSGICLCDESTVDHSNYINKKNYGYGFYSTYLEKNTLLKQGIMKYISNIDVFLKVVIFDHLIYNTDRNIGNLLVEYRKKNIFVSVIDHSHVFKNQTIWDSNCFKIGIEENDYADNDIMIHNEQLYQMFYMTINITYENLTKCAHEMQSILTEHLLGDIMSQIPHEWHVSDINLIALKNYILYRLEHLDQICTVIIDYIKA
ncbi:HipA family kinase [Clostridium sp. Marseille-P2415]|uniref:HipA family kinase n=1 Tax=Clostridium sp. Marseille-P2415 TaxID=1805471 RepID=UPI00098836DD|nr:HipA family kinase [Clostridium sp. Marseille-P2415]